VEEGILPVVFETVEPDELDDDEDEEADEDELEEDEDEEDDDEELDEDDGLGALFPSPAVLRSSLPAL
jgi:hypothetical protein